MLYADQSRLLVGDSEVAHLKAIAAGNPRRRVRLCGHAGTDAPVHEMLIVHGRDCYVPPHRHHGKAESLHVIDGAAQMLFFDDAGRLEETVQVGPPGSGRCFFCRLDRPYFHSIVIESDWLVFMEVTKGPFVRADTEWAPWAPAADDPDAGRDFLASAVARRVRSA